MDSITGPQLKRLPVDAPIEEFITAITRDGGCICTNYVTPKEVSEANAEVKPFLDANKPWQVSSSSYNSLHLQIADEEFKGQAVSTGDKKMQPASMAKS